MTNSIFQSGAKELRRALERQLPDDPNFRRVRKSGGSENRVGEKTGQSTTTKDLRLIEEPTGLQAMRREGGPEDTTSDMTVHATEDVLDRGDRIERISDGTPFKVDRITPRRWNDVLVGYEIQCTEQDS